MKNERKKSPLNNYTNFINVEKRKQFFEQLPPAWCLGGDWEATAQWLIADWMLSGWHQNQELEKFFLLSGNNPLLYTPTLIYVSKQNQFQHDSKLFFLDQISHANDRLLINKPHAD